MDQVTLDEPCLLRAHEALQVMQTDYLERSMSALRGKDECESFHRVERCVGPQALRTAVSPESKRGSAVEVSVAPHLYSYFGFIEY